MPPSYTRMHGRDDASSDPNAVGPGQRISVDGGIDSARGIIAVILAIALFILVLILYHFLTVELARREKEEEEARKSGRLNNQHRKSKSEDPTHIIRIMSDLFERCISYFKRVTSKRKRRSFDRSGSHISMEALLRVKPRTPPQQRKFPNLLCIARRTKSKLKREPRRMPRPLLLNRNTDYATYMPRSSLDEETTYMLRSPDAFAEYSDPVRNMNFVRMQDEVQRRKERDEIWYETPSDAPGRPVNACVYPPAFRTKTKQSGLRREGDVTDNEWPSPSPERVIYPARQGTKPSTSASSSRWESHNPHSSGLPRSSQYLATIRGDSEPRTLHSLFDTGVDENKGRIHRRKSSLKFPIPPSSKASPPRNEDVFSIGSFSDSGEESVY